MMTVDEVLAGDWTLRIDEAPMDLAMGCQVPRGEVFGAAEQRLGFAEVPSAIAHLASLGGAALPDKGHPL